MIYTQPVYFAPFQMRFTTAYLGWVSLCASWPNYKHYHFAHLPQKSYYLSPSPPYGLIFYPQYIISLKFFVQYSLYKWQLASPFSRKSSDGRLVSQPLPLKFKRFPNSTFSQSLTAKCVLCEKRVLLTVQIMITFCPGFPADCRALTGREVMELTALWFVLFKPLSALIQSFIPALFPTWNIRQDSAGAGSRWIDSHG